MTQPKQTAIEWLVKELEEHHVFYDIKNTTVYQIAKQMEKEQIKEAHFTSSGYNLFGMPIDKINSAYKAAEQYYNETYGKTN